MHNWVMAIWFFANPPTQCPLNINDQVKYYGGFEDQEACQAALNKMKLFSHGRFDGVCFDKMRSPFLSSTIRAL